MPAPTAYVSQPQISINGQGKDTLNTNVLSMFVEETIEGLFRCEACFSNFGAQQGGGTDYLYFGRDVLDFVKEIAIKLGSGEQPVEILKGCITGIQADYPEQGGSQILVLAEDKLQYLR